MFRRCSLCLSYVTILIVALCVVGPIVEAFQPTPLPSLSVLPTTITPTAAQTTTSSTTVILHAIKPPSFNKKKQQVVTTPVEKEKSNSALDLVLLYMTPWKNPNSIFVYLLMGLIALGKYSEAQSLAGKM